eukprot:CAMPEP_0170497232 /NCGR_PEP_ID=MMETSP0208-20121228/24155_1 /TAXON_ID=197538 /ORGANISM="Strombidium inclinatum, Strain S3" /LENGTH=121 /DNA_ID=CAMNT_0010773987 /DNA_START=50 /DNA_END=411 /DNA_ORIENTATION=+
MLKTDPAIVINWQQFTKNADTGAPLHAENGFLKILPMPLAEIGSECYKAELMLSHPFSVNEMYKDCFFNFENSELFAQALDPECFQRGPTSKGREVTGYKRHFRLSEENQLMYDAWLGFNG